MGSGEKGFAGKHYGFMPQRERGSEGKERHIEDTATLFLVEECSTFSTPMHMHMAESPCRTKAGQ
jgi:hypothetical protein